MNDLKKFIYIKDRFQYKRKSEVAQTSDYYDDDSGSFTVEYNDYEEFRNKMLLEIRNLFEGDKEKPICANNFFCKRLEEQLEKVEDSTSMERFISALINCSGINLKLHCKVINDGFVYFFKNKQIIRYEFNSKVFSYKPEHEFHVVWDQEVIWAKQKARLEKKRKWEEKQKARGTFQQEEKKPIKSLDEFYKVYSKDKMKD